MNRRCTFQSQRPANIRQLAATHPLVLTRGAFVESKLHLSTRQKWQQTANSVTCSVAPRKQAAIVGIWSKRFQGKNCRHTERRHHCPSETLPSFQVQTQRAVIACLCVSSFLLLPCWPFVGLNSQSEGFRPGRNWLKTPDSSGHSRKARARDARRPSAEPCVELRLAVPADTATEFIQTKCFSRS